MLGPQLMALLGMFKRRGLVGEGVSLEVGFEVSTDTSASQCTALWLWIKM